MTKQIFIDTDMGADCDDVAAVAILAHYHKLKKIELIGITHTSAAPRAVEYLDMVSRFYGYETTDLATASPQIGIGELSDNFFDNVLRGFSYKNPEHNLNAVQLMRKQLSKAKDATILCIGPLNNMSAFLNSQADDISPLSGREILKQNVKEVVVMGGIFGNKRYKFYHDIYEIEYNIGLDIKGAKNFITNCPTKLTFVEFELGYDVKSFANTVAASYDTPIKRAYTLFGVKSRESWDVVAALYCVFGTNGYYLASNEGECLVADDGRTVFREKAGGIHRYLYENVSKSEIMNYIESIENELQSI